MNWLLNLSWPARTRSEIDAPAAPADVVWGGFPNADADGLKKALSIFESISFLPAPLPKLDFSRPRIPIITPTILLEVLVYIGYRPLLPSRFLYTPKTNKVLCQSIPENMAARVCRLANGIRY